MSRRYSKRKNKRFDFKNQIIVKQVDKIDALEKEIRELEIDNEAKDELINSIDGIRENLFGVIDDLRSQSDKYDKLIAELNEMKNVMNQTVFKGRWKLIRLLLR